MEIVTNSKMKNIKLILIKQGHLVSSSSIFDDLNKAVNENQ